MITKKGHLLPQHAHLASHVRSLDERKQKKVLLLGSGRVAQPVVDYLLKRSSDFHVTVASNVLAEAQVLTKNRPNTQASVVDVTDDGQLRQLVSAHDLVVRWVFDLWPCT